MPVYQLGEDPIFPPVDHAEEGGLLAVGGDLSPERLLMAYRLGIFPWYSDPHPILWWSPEPRCVLFPENIKVAKSMRPVMKRKTFQFTLDKDFVGVISRCQKAERPDQEEEEGSWITPEMQAAYIDLHELGYAHSVEAWQDDRLVGGLYGVSLGRCFFGESMFADVPNASKAALIFFGEWLMERDYQLIDCQVETAHLMSMGAELMPRNEFVDLLDDLCERKTTAGNWGFA